MARGNSTNHPTRLTVEEKRLRRNASQKRWCRNNPDQRRIHYRRRELKKFNLTLEQYDAMLLAQGGVCGICKLPERRIDSRNGQRLNLAVDHCHATGKVRGLLCWMCNSRLPQMEQVDWRESALHYLEQYQ